jgi:hypothetical protein
MQHITIDLRTKASRCLENRSLPPDRTHWLAKHEAYLNASLAVATARAELLHELRTQDEPRCNDCSSPDKPTGHMDCQYPGLNTP